MGEALVSKILRFIFSELFLVIFIAVVVAVAGYYSLTGLSLKNFWIDRVAHFSGGFWSAAIFIYVFRRYPELNRFASFFQSRILTVIFVLGFTALIGVLWEIDEFVFSNIGSLADTMEDLVLDLMGAVLAIFLAEFWLSRK